MNFGQLAGDNERAIPKQLLYIGQTIENAVRRLIRDYGCLFVPEFLKYSPPRCCLRGKKADESKLVRRQAGACERGKDHGGSGNRDDRESALDCACDQTVTGVGYKRSACVAHECNGLPAFEAFDKLRRSTCLIVLVVANQGFSDSIVAQQLLGLSRILARDQRDLVSQNTKRPQCNVFEITDGSGDEVESARQRLS